MADLPCPKSERPLPPLVPPLGGGSTRRRALLVPGVGDFHSLSGLFSHMTPPPPSLVAAPRLGMLAALRGLAPVAHISSRTPIPLLSCLAPLGPAFSQRRATFAASRFASGAACGQQRDPPPSTVSNGFIGPWLRPFPRAVAARGAAAASEGAAVTAPATEYVAVAFYGLAEVKDPLALVAEHRKYVLAHDIRCRIYISEQGINAQVSGPVKVTARSRS